jgi:hypothetical protein
MSERNEQKEKQLFSVVRILVGGLAVLAVFIVLLAVLQHRIRTHSWWRQSSSTDLSGLGKAMEIYGNDSDRKLPSAEDANELKRRE